MAPTRRIAAAATITAVALTVTAKILARRYVVVTVEGMSMRPNLQPGDRVLVLRCSAQDLRKGDVVVIAPPRSDRPIRSPAGLGDGPGSQLWVVKRVAALPGDPVPESVWKATSRAYVPDRSLVLLGDHHHSTDSRQLGFFSTDALLGKVRRRLYQPR